MALPRNRARRRLSQETQVGARKALLANQVFGSDFIEYGCVMAHNRCMSETSIPLSATTYPMAVIMQRKALVSRWATEMWEVKGVVPDNAPAGSGQKVIVRN